MIGSDKRAIEKALGDAVRTPKPALQVTAEYGDGIVNASAAGDGPTADKDAELWFALTEDHLVVDVKRGENANKTMKHSGVVRLLKSAGGVDQTSKRVSLQPQPLLPVSGVSRPLSLLPDRTTSGLRCRRGARSLELMGMNDLRNADPGSIETASSRDKLHARFRSSRAEIGRVRLSDGAQSGERDAVSRGPSGGHARQFR